jgi:hypothetical protein
VSSSAPTVALYRTLVPAHKAVSDDLIQTYLDDAVGAHNVAIFGNRYDRALIWWAAHQIERTPGLGLNGDAASEAGAITAQSDSQEGSTLSRSYAATPTRDPEDAEWATTRYGMKYLEIRNSRIARAPYALGPG